MSVLGKPAVLYVRMSKEELEQEPHLSPEAQETALRAHCTERGLNPVEVARDIGVRSSQPFESRKGGRTVITLVRDGAAEAVVSLTLDRLFQNATAALRFGRAWHRAGVTLHLVDMAGKPVDSRAIGDALFDTLEGAAEMERHELKENQVASAIQATLVPDSNLVQLPGIDLAGTVRPATYCWGDWWNYYQLVGSKTLVIIGDVTGHGVASAIVASAAQSAAALLMDERQGNFDLQALFKAMNVAIQRAARGRLFMTCFASIYDPASRMLTYANAGHNFSFVYEVDKKKLSTLVVRGQRLGDTAPPMAEVAATPTGEPAEPLEEYTVKQTEVAPNTTIVWYSDGILECESFDGEEYGARRFRRMITKNAHLRADQMRDQLISDAIQFFGEVPPRDDITLVVGRIH